MIKPLFVALTLLSLTMFVSLQTITAQTSPASLSGLQLWLDAADPNANATLPANGSVVTSWRDKSGNNRHASIVSSGVYSLPSYQQNQINGNGTMRFTGTTVDGAGFSSPLDIRAMTNPEITVFTVYKQGARTSNQAVWGCDDGGFDRFFFSTWNATPDNGSVSTGQVAPNLQTVVGSGILNKVQCLTAVYSKASGTNGSAIYLNGSKITTFTDATTTGADAIAAVRIGLDGNDNFFTGDIAEMIVYNRKLSECEITQINRYLNVKYDVSFTNVVATAAGPTTIKEGERVTLNTTTTGTSHQWLKDNQVISGATGTSYTATQSGSYRVAVTNSCIDTSAAIVVVAQTPAAPDNALHFDGVNDYLDAGSTVMAGNIRTLECWAMFNNLTADQEILSKSKSGYGIELLLYNNRLSFFCMNGPDVSHISYPNTNFVTGRWYHLAATWDGSTRESMKLFVDGREVGTRTDLGNLNTAGIADPGAGSKLYVGAWTDAGRYFNGTLDEVRIWSSTRTQAQVRDYAYDTLSRNSANLLLYLRMDQGVAAGTNTGNTSLKDYSSFARSVTATNFTLSTNASNYVESYAMAVPVLLNASAAGSSSFMANWSAPITGTLTNYRLDVATDPNFTTMLSGYSNLAVGNVTSQEVTVPSISTTYYYRVRANKTSVAGQGANSWTYMPASVAILLPVKFESFTADAVSVASTRKTSITWSASAEINTLSFSVERSANGTNFTTIGSASAQGSGAGVKEYQFVDSDPGFGANYYRIVSIDRDGKKTYTAVKSVFFEQLTKGIKIYPSPATSFIFADLRSTSFSAGIGSIYTLTGQHVKNIPITTALQKIDITALVPGVYLFRFESQAPIKFEKQSF